MAKTISDAESQFERILRRNGFKTATLKEYVRAPSIQGGRNDYIILPDIMAVDEEGRGWCFEVKDERHSKLPMRNIHMTKGYSGPIWFLEDYKARSYLDFSGAFQVPCIIAIRGDRQWKVGFLTCVKENDGTIDYNRDLIAPEWKDPDGIPILFNVLFTLD